MRKILITGGVRTIGSNLVKRLVKENNEVFVIDNLWRGRLDYLNDENNHPVISLKTHFFNKDLRQPDIANDALSKVEYVVHWADVVAEVDYVFNNQGSLFRENLLINSNIIASARKNANKLKGFIYAGTTCSFPLTHQNSLDVIPMNFILPCLSEAKKSDKILYTADSVIGFGVNKAIAIVHDLNEFEFVSKFGKIRTYFRKRMIRRIMRYAQSIVVISNFVKQQVYRQFKEMQNDERNQISKDKLVQIADKFSWEATADKYYDLLMR